MKRSNQQSRQAADGSSSSANKKKPSSSKPDNPEEMEPSTSTGQKNNPPLVSVHQPTDGPSCIMMDGVPDSNFEEYTKLRVIFRKLDNESHYRVKRFTGMNFIMQSYCSRLDLNIDAYKFMHRGSELKPEDTVNSLEMEDNDVIKVYEKKIKGVNLFTNK